MNGGGAAFPHAPMQRHDNEFVTYGEIGMSLRDWFAATTKPDVELPRELAVSLMGSEPPGDPAGQLTWGLRLSAKLLYMHADAMLAERERRVEPSSS